MYSSFEVPKKNGDKRHIDAPDIRLKNIQRSLARLLMSLYLIMLRIEYAKKLLLTTDLPIEEVIWQCGYSNKGFFYKKFKESTGLNPMRFRASGSSLL